MKLRSNFIYIFYFLCILIILYITMNSSTINKFYINKDSIKYESSIDIYSVKDKINRWINIPTYDGSGEATHPKVLYFKESFNGYKYWMVNTPYTYNNAYLENPSIVVSNDGIKWEEPKGINNPVSGYPSKIRDDSYYSDPFMLFDEDHFELFFRKTKSVLNGRISRNGYNYLYMQTSNDGITWTEPKLILDNNVPERYMSVSVIKTDGLYKMWYVNYEGNVRYIESTDLESFTKPIDVNIKDFNKNVWHGEVQYIGNKYIYIFMIKYNLYYTKSTDGINFDNPKLINTNLESLDNVINHIYKTTYIISDDYIELYIPYRVKYKWKLHYTKVDKNYFLENI